SAVRDAPTEQVHESVAYGGPPGAPAPHPMGPARRKEASAPMLEEKMADGEASPQMMPSVATMDRDFNTESYDSISENGFVSVALAPLSTFSVDVDTASYSNVRRFIQQGSLPPGGAVRIEELINYFDYGYQSPSGDRPFSVHTELSTAPWAGEH